MHIFTKSIIGLVAAAAVTSATVGVIAARSNGAPDEPAFDAARVLGLSGPRAQAALGERGPLPATQRAGQGLIGVAAEALGLTPEELLAQLSEGATPADVAIAQGVDPSALVDALVAPLAERVSAWVLEGPTVHPRGSAERPPDRRGLRAGARVRQFLTRSAEAIGIDLETLRAGIQGGQSIAEIAAANGSSADAVVAALVSQGEERLQRAVESGRLSADEAAAKLAEITTRITERITTGPPQCTV